MHLPPFEGPRQKVARGYKHIADLKKVIADFAASSSVVATHLPQEDRGGATAWRIEFSEPEPSDIPLIFGDALHNFRSALDLMIGDLVDIRDVKVKRARYPFAIDADAVRITYQSNLGNLGDDILDAILATQPYRGGNALLRGLHDLDINDKHEWITPMYLGAIGNFNIPTIARAFLAQSFGVDIGGETTIWIGSCFRLKTGVNPNSMINIVPESHAPYFGEASPCFPGQPFIATLENIGQLVGEIVASFASQFGRGNLEAQRAPLGDAAGVVDLPPSIEPFFEMYNTPPLGRG